MAPTGADAPATDWEFANPVRIVGGIDSAAQIPSLARADDGSIDGIVVVTSAGARARGDLDAVLAGFGADVPVRVVSAAPNPDLVEVDDELARLSADPVSCVVAIGGGSVMDTAKALAIGLGNPGFTARGHFFGGEPIPVRRRCRLICVPTTAGTGSEVTPYATVWDRANAKKLSLTGPAVFPDVAVLDASLTLSLPRDVTISTGLDALTQAFEATWSRRANPVSDAFAVRALAIGLDTLGPLVAKPDDIGLRQAMLEASLLAGMAISRTRTALCHSISYPITGHYGVPHGLACALTLSEVFAFNQAGESSRMNELARSLDVADAGELHDRLECLLVELGTADLLAPYFAGHPHPAALAGEMLTPGRADNNARSATVADVATIVRSAVENRSLSVIPEAAGDGVR